MLPQECAAAARATRAAALRQDRCADADAIDTTAAAAAAAAADDDEGGADGAANALRRLHIADGDGAPTAPPPRFAYGGDFGPRGAPHLGDAVRFRGTPSDEAFCINGLVQPDRRLNPHAWEAKHAMRPVGVTLVGVAHTGDGGAALTVRNPNPKPKPKPKP